MQILIVFLPLIGFFSGSLFGSALGFGVCIITTICTFFAFCLSVYSFLQISTGIIYKIQLGNWIVFDSLNVGWSFLFDSLTVVMLLVVTMISTLVHLYSINYMENDPHLNRFMSYLSLFTFFMLILVTANNFLQMFVGWEGVGLSSYLLINFWFTRIQANKSAIKAMLVNRVGDFFILLALFSILFVYNSLDYNILFSLIPLTLKYNVILFDFQISAIDLICLFLFLGAMGKSAQLGLHTWLPDAMEGPTPVSALIHAATMVTAGVFLIARCSFLFEYSPLILNIIIFIGALTAFFAATTGLFQNDLKKVIAYSTCSQLGYMIFACGLSSYDLGMFHLANHAFFKALLFLGAGSIIHALADEQDMRKMGGLKNILPFSYSIMLIGSLALMGFPFLTGFYSKDVILEAAFIKFTTMGHYSYLLGTLAAFFTAFYSIRLLFLVFLAEPNGARKVILSAHEGAWPLSTPLFILSLFSIGIGYLTKDFFIGFGSNSWNNSIFILPINYLLCDVEFISVLPKILPLVVTLLGASFAFFLYAYGVDLFFFIKQNKYFKLFYIFLNKKWYIDRLYNENIGQNVLFFSYQFAYKSLDRGLLEAYGPFNFVNFFKFIQSNIKYLQSGNIFYYLFLFFISINFLVLFLFFFF